MLKDLEIQTADKFLINGYKSTHLDFRCRICTGCSTAFSKKRRDVDFEIPVLKSYDPEEKVV